MPILRPQRCRIASRLHSLEYVARMDGQQPSEAIWTNHSGTENEYPRGTCLDGGDGLDVRPIVLRCLALVGLTALRLLGGKESEGWRPRTPLGRFADAE